MPPLIQESTGRRYWRSLEELADTPEFRARLEQEFPPGFFDNPDRISRRRLLQLMGASLALAGLTGCRRWPERTLLPESRRAEGAAPGQAERYATALELGGVAKSLLVTSFDGRPIKVEGNPLHPASRGTADVLAQAAVLELYDPERSQQTVRRTQGVPKPGDRAAWDAFARSHFREYRTRKGAGLSVLSEATSSPSVAMLRQEIARILPQAKWHTYEPLDRDAELAGAWLALGQPLRTHLHLDRAAVLVCFDADLMMRHPDALTIAAGWASRRRQADADGTMNRMYAVESTFTITGSCADQRIAVRSSEIPGLLVQLDKLLTELSATADNPADAAAESSATGAGSHRVFLRQLARDLLANRGGGLIVVGPGQPPEAHALAHKLNADLGNAGVTLSYSKEPVADPHSGVEALRELVTDISTGQVDALLIIGGNPVYDAPADLDIAAALAKVPTTIHLSLYDNETSQACMWHLPRAHWLESWGDARSFDGTICLTQPLIDPLFDGISALELLAELVELSAEQEGKKQPVSQAIAVVRHTARGLLGDADFETRWAQAVSDGFLPDTAAKPVTPQVKANLPSPVTPATDDDDLELVFLSAYGVYDGRYANNGWLQEWPDPMTKLTWDNAGLIAPQTAERLGLCTGDLVMLSVGERTLEVAVYIMPGTAENVIGLSLGYGRTAAGHIGNRVGFNAYALRTGAARHAVKVLLAKQGGTYPLATTMDHSTIQPELLAQQYNERIEELVREQPLSEFLANQRRPGDHGHGHSLLQLWQEPNSGEQAAPHQWGMAIDLNACTGCGACIIACQAENNIPIVGKQEVATGRQMHWLRVDRYFHGLPEAPEAIHQPVACHHCENAPCEQVCPANATVHDSEGLNVMVYNRCVGTRYCSNNCPYKVRHFNFVDWHTNDPRREGWPVPYIGLPDQQQGQVDEIKRMVFNPEVTVRMRGVMEKCTYCVQRIKASEQTARLEHTRGERPDNLVRDGEMVPACAQTCPTQAIVFGNLRDPESRVSKAQHSARSYVMLGELNVRPRTKYLMRLRNLAEVEGQPAAPTADAAAAPQSTEANATQEPFV